MTSSRAPGAENPSAEGATDEPFAALARLQKEWAIDRAYETGHPIDGNHGIIDDPYVWPDWFETDRAKYPERRLRGPIIDHFKPQGWRVFFNPDGADLFDAMLVHGTDVMYLELKVSAWRKAFEQAYHRLTYQFNFVGVVMPHNAAYRLLKFIVNESEDWERIPALAQRGEAQDFIAKRIGVYGVDDGKLKVFREPERLSVDSYYDERHDRAIRWTRIFDKDRHLARRVAFTYLTQNYKTTKGILLTDLDRMGALDSFVAPSADGPSARGARSPSSSSEPLE